jgi:azurin
MNFMNLNRYLRAGLCLALFGFITAGLLVEGAHKGPAHQNQHTGMSHGETAGGADVALLQGRSVSVANGDTVVIKSFGADLSYDITEIRATAGDTFTIEYDNSQSDMPHNIVFVNSRADIQPVGVASLRASQNDYIPEDEASLEKIFGYTKLARPGDTVYVTITVPDPGTYPYICTYPGHFTMMQGQLISE